jgi:hypothetical protein
MTEDKNPMKRQVKVYVAGSSHTYERERVHRILNLVKEHPYLQLTHDWLAIIERVRTTTADSALAQEDRVHYAMGDLTGVQQSDIFWYLHPNEIPSHGASFEFGAAWGLASQWSMDGVYTGHSRVLIVSGPKHRVSIFCALADHQWGNDAEAYQWLDSHARYLIEG